MAKQPAIFEQIKKTTEIGQEYWSARELFKALEYIKMGQVFKRNC